MAEPTNEELAAQLEAAVKRANKAEQDLADAQQAKEATDAALGEIRERAEQATAGETSKTGVAMTMLTNPTLYIIGVIAALLLYTVYRTITAEDSGDGALLYNLQDPAFARGLITFIFSLGTLGIGVILTVAALRQGDDAAEAFTRGKEIFTILVGILGTIVGFYFGTASDEDASDSSGLTVSGIEASTSSPTGGSPFELSSSIEGGSPPYLAVWSFSELLDPQAVEAPGAGEVSKEFTFPAQEDEVEVLAELLVSDAEGLTGKQTLRLEVQAGADGG